MDSHDANTHIIANQNSDSTAFLYDANSTENLSNIHDSARITDWPKVQSLATTQPSHASYKCDHGLTALHHACSRRCPHPAVFAALINAYPNALIEKDYDKGWTPLHHACRFKCPAKCVELLLNSYPDFGRYACRVRDQRNGRTPLYYAIRYDAPDGVVELLLNCMERSDILGCDKDGTSVLGLVWDRWATSFEGKRIVRYYSKILKQWKEQRKKLDFFAENQLENNEEFRLAEEKWWNGVLSDSKTLRDGVKGKLAQNWDKANLLLRGAFKFDLSTKDDVGCDSEEDKIGGINDEKKGDANDYVIVKLPATKRRRKFRILHATGAIGCHESLFTMACALYPHQAREMDEGDLFGGDEKVKQAIPIPKRRGSLESPRRKNMATKQGEEEDNREFQDGEDHSQDCLTALHICAKSPNSGPDSRHALQNLILFNPRAAAFSNPADKSLPFHYICENESKVHWTQDGIRLLYQAYPDAATKLDWKGRTPLHRAATLQESAPTQMMFVTSESQHLMNLNVTEPTGIYGTLRISLNSTSAGTASASGRTLTSGEASIPSTATLSSSRFSIASVEDQAGSIIQNILFLHPEVASIRDSSGKTPFHSIAEYGEVWDRNVQAIYDAHTGALSMRDDTPLKSLPMHLVAANTHAKSSFVRKILECHPRTSSMVNGVGMLPLHLACGAGKRWEDQEDHEEQHREKQLQHQEQHQDDENDEGDENDVGAAIEEESYGGGLKDIYEAFPGAIGTMDDEGKWTPLHCAVATSHHTSRQTIEKLLELGPNAAHAVDAMGRTPFHLAVESGRGWEDGLDLLFEANPDAIDAPDTEGKIPVVAALLRYCVSNARQKNRIASHSGLDMLGPSSMDSTESLENSPSRAHLLPLEEESLIDDMSDVEITRPSAGNHVTDAAVAITAHPSGSIEEAQKCNDSADVQEISQVNVLFHLLRNAPQVLRPQDGAR